MTVAPAGSFQMGSTEKTDEQPVHGVTISEPFAAGVCEVTFDEWNACVQDGGCRSNQNPNDHGWGKGTRPVIEVTWNHAKEYVKWLSDRTGEEYRLLTESEWEYAARARTTTPWHFGSTITTSQANYFDSGFERTTPVGTHEPNAFGLYDVHGNVAEWTEDCYRSSYDGNNDGDVQDPEDAPTNGSAWVDSEDCTRVLRGGSYFNSPQGMRSSSRGGATSSFRGSVNGFRVARTL